MVLQVLAKDDMQYNRRIRVISQFNYGKKRSRRFIGGNTDRSFLKQFNCLMACLSVAGNLV